MDEKLKKKSGIQKAERLLIDESCGDMVRAKAMWRRGCGPSRLRRTRSAWQNKGPFPQ